MRTIMRRSGPMWAVVLIAAVLSVPGAAGAQSPSKSQSPKKNVWNGVMEYFADATNAVQSSPIYDCGTVKYHYTVRFRFVENGPGAKHRFSPMSINWSGSGRAYTAGYQEQTCGGSGGVDETGAWTKADEKAWGARFPCKTTELSAHTALICQAKPQTDFPHVVPMEKLRDGCSYSEEGHGYRYSVWLSPQADAVIKVTTDKSGPDNKYWNFVPEPDATISFLVRSSIPSLFRFTLEDVSALPGYATNAVVDDSFFALFPSLQHLKGQYRNDSPDLIFDPANYKSADWKAPSFGEVETVKFSSAATVTVTAMDYGAYGHLHAYFKGICGGWMPVTIKWDKPPASGGQRPPGITIPMDDNGNLIADRMEETNNGLTQWAYTGDPGADNDDKPAGDNVAGDGLTTFEEYRGFMVKGGPDCSNLTDVRHIRTDPSVKDLFIRADDPDLEKIAPRFEFVSGLAVHLICPQQYAGDSVREVNFTLHPGQLPSGSSVQLEGKTISQDAAQHGLYLKNEELPGGIYGETFPRIGPPRNVQVVRVSKAKIMRAHGGARRPGDYLARTIFHELGHAISIRHHGEGNIDGPVVIVNVTKCTDDTVASSGAGTKACKAFGIAVRRQQNSGEQSCPMKYIDWDWYVPPGTSLIPVGKVTFNRFLHRSQELDGYRGLLKRYLNTIDSPGLGKFCTSKKGTGINALPGDLNHAGDAQFGNCASQIHVNDVR
jgi:hypothetical protein